MRIYTAVFGLLLAIIGCSQNPNSGVGGSDSSFGEDRSAVLINDTVCYERYSGSRNQDTASIALIIEGEKVTGRYAIIPYEKDSRAGTINGSRSGDVIKGIWRFQQEGIQDSLPFEFKLIAGHLLQKATSFNESTGRETLSNTASFSLKFAQVDCQVVNRKIR